MKKLTGQFYMKEVYALCGIAGFCNFNKNFMYDEKHSLSIVEQMGKTLTHRGPDDFGSIVSEHAAFAHTRLAVIDVEHGAQPMSRTINNASYTIVYNGELYNTDELRKELLKKGYHFTTTSDTEVLLIAYIAYGNQVCEKLNGIYSFVIWNGFTKTIFFCRDRFGVKPLFYTLKDGTFIFGSEIKALLAYPDISPVINQYGLCEIFGLGPARSPGCGVFENIHEVPPGYCGTFDYNGIKLYPYFTLKAAPHTESYEDTVAHVRELLVDAIERQLISDVPLCTLLSGGLDSSIISAVAARYLEKQGRTLDTYSFDYKDNAIHFTASSFQPDEDRPFVDIMLHSIHTKHHYLECNALELFDSLFWAVDAKDLPGMTDVDASMLFFARKIKENHTVCLSGECADEVFGGYPWFRDTESYSTRRFPWAKNLEFRKEVLTDELQEKLPLEEYVQAQYEKTIASMSKSETDSPLHARQREISFLNTSWFMSTLLDRKDRMTMANGLEVRVPFADHRIISYLYNIPWEYKYHNHEVKKLLKDAMSDFLPKEVIERKKCPYPKTYDPSYEYLLKKELKNILSDANAPILPLIDKEKLYTFMNSPSDYGKPWFGQLMALPQMYAYLIQINYWLNKYHITICL